MKRRLMSILVAGIIAMQGIAPAMAEEIEYEEEFLIEDSGELLDEESEMTEEPEEVELVENFDFEEEAEE